MLYLHKVFKVRRYIYSRPIGFISLKLQIEASIFSWILEVTFLSGHNNVVNLYQINSLRQL